MTDKITDRMGPPVATKHGMRVHMRQDKAKTSRGKNYLWTSMRQDGKAKRWRFYQVLSYPHGVDIQWEEQTQTGTADEE